MFLKTTSGMNNFLQDLKLILQTFFIRFFKMIKSNRTKRRKRKQELDNIQKIYYTISSYNIQVELTYNTDEFTSET